MAHRVLNSSEDVREYERYLDEGWPERAEIARHLARSLYRSRADSPRVLELACGPGALAAAILDEMPVQEYVGVDITAASLDYAAARLSGSDAETKWVQGDLNGTTWLDQVGDGFDAVVSIQSIHDLGGNPEVRRIFAAVRDLLAPGGRFLYADLLRQPDDPPDAHPGRFTVNRHLELLDEAGFDNASCTLELGGFGCFETELTADRA